MREVIIIIISIYSYLNLLFPHNLPLYNLQKLKILELNSINKLLCYIVIIINSKFYKSSRETSH